MGNRSGRDGHARPTSSKNHDSMTLLKRVIATLQQRRYEIDLEHQVRERTGEPARVNDA